MIFCSKHALQENLSRIVEWFDLINFFFVGKRKFFYRATPASFYIFG